MIKNLPNWCITDDQPAFYDTESATAIEMVAKLYAKMQELIEDYSFNNKNLVEIVEDFKKIINENFNVFSVELRQEFQDFIDVIELKVKGNQKQIEEAVDYMKLNIDQTAKDIINLKIQNGEINVGLQYTEDTESLNILLEGSVMTDEGI